MKKITTSLIALAALSSTSFAQLIVNEGFDYPTSGSYDIDGGLNGGNGLPATNVGGDPSGTGVGLRGSTWGGTINSGSLSYGSLETSGGSLSGSGFVGNVAVYRNMNTDPFVSYRVGGTTSFFTDFGEPGTTLWFSTLLSTDTVGDANSSVLRIGNPGFNNNWMEIGINSSALSGANNDNFSIAGSFGGVISTTEAVANTTYLLVGSIDFAAGNDDVNVWINPTIGGALGTADLSFTTTSSFEFRSFGFRTQGSATGTWDELRLGTSLESVTPVPEPSAYALIAGFLGLTWVMVRRRG